MDDHVLGKVVDKLMAEAENEKSPKKRFTGCGGMSKGSKGGAGAALPSPAEQETFRNALDNLSIDASLTRSACRLEKNPPGNKNPTTKREPSDAKMGVQISSNGDVRVDDADMSVQVSGNGDVRVDLRVDDAALTSQIENTPDGPSENTTAGEEKAGEDAKQSSKTGAAGDNSEPADDDANKSARIAEDWAKVWTIIAKNPDMADGSAGVEFFRTFVRKAINDAKGPVCANPGCNKPGHTIAVCPGPVCDVYGDMLGCFFCNLFDHEADDCPMMETVTPEALITHLITNRAGLPPFRTVIDWVALALDNWDLISLHMLPLTRAYVLSDYVPKEPWTLPCLGRGVSHFTDPLFQDLTLKKFRALAKPKGKDKATTNGSITTSETNTSRKLMEAMPDHARHCVCGKAHDRPVYKNKWIQKYVVHCECDMEEAAAARERALEASRAELAKKQPKKVDKEEKQKQKMGRRAMKKAAAAAEAEAKAKAAAPADEQKKEDSPDEDSSEDEVPLSERMMQLTEQMDEFFDKLRGIVRS